MRETQQDGATSTVRDYVGEFVLVGGAMDYLIHEEGKVSYESGVPRYEFFVKDHLGNVRQVIRAPEQAMRVATMEPDRAEEEEEEFGNIKESRQPAAAHNTTPGGYATAWLNAARNRTLGPNRTQEVQEGDSITLMVEGKYLDIKAGAIRPKDLLQPVEGAPASPLLTDLGQPISVGGVNQFLLFKALHLLITGIQQKPAPEAYLGYALYDADSNLYDQGRIVLSKKARNRHEELKTRIFVPKDGYIEAYVVNESDEDVWFDQFRILSTGPVIVQETHYDPWGVELQGLGYQQGGLKANKYLYNGKEFNDHQGLNLFDYGARMYDASVGRFFSTDRFSEKYFALNPYQYGANNPVLFIDINGDSIAFSGSEEFRTRAKADLAKLKNSGDKDVVGMISYLESSETIVTVSEATSLLGAVKNFLNEGSGDVDHVKASNARGNGVDPLSGENGVTVEYSQIGGVEIDGVKTQSHTTLGHELQHAKDIVDGTLSNKRSEFGKNDPGGQKLVDFAETRALQMENKIRKAEGNPVVRMHYNGKLLINSNGTKK